MSDILEEESRTVKHSTRDSVFTALFRDKKNVFRLYKELHTEDTTTTVDDIIIDTLQSVLINDIYNDLGFLVYHADQAKLVVLAEAQTKWSNNLTLRILLYLAETYRRYLKANKLNEHLEEKVHLPKPELFVIYTGKKDVPDVISLADTYFNGESPVEIKVKILKTPSTDTIYGQYIGFCKVYEEQRKLFGKKLSCIKETIRICLEKGYLPQFLNEHKKEVDTMLSDLFDEQAMREAYDIALKAHLEKKAKAEGIAKGIAKGRAEGIAEGREEGRAEGREEGRKEGREEGIKIGRAEGNLEMLIDLVRDGDLSIEKAASKAKLTVEEFKKKICW